MTPLLEQIGYFAYFAESERRFRHGERQRRCLTCKRWWWPHWEREQEMHQASCSDPRLGRIRGRRG